MISERLQKAISYDPTKQSQSQTISKLNSDIENKKLSLPIYQRDLSWTLKKAVDLFNYQLFGKAPVSPLSLNKISKESNNRINQIELIDRGIIDDDRILEGHLSIIDGQQRMTTNYKAYIDHPSFTNIVLDLSRGKFRLLVSSPNKTQIPVGKLLNKDQTILSNYLNEQAGIKDFTIMSTVLQIRTKLHQYSYTLHIAENMTEDEQIEWFEVLNNAGSKVSALQMTFAKLGSIDFDIYSEYGEVFKQKIQDYDLNNLITPYTTNVSYPVALLNPELEKKLEKSHGSNYAPIPSDTKEKQLARLPESDLKYIAEKTLESLQAALDFVETNNLSDIVDRMDYILYLSGYISFNGLDESNKEKLINWVNSVNFQNKSNRERREVFTNMLAM